MDFNRRHGFTLVEAIMVMVIITILAVPGAFLMTYLIRNAVYIPNKLNTDMIAMDAMNIMIDGDGQAVGLRTSRVLTNIQDNDITFINQNNQMVRYFVDTSTTPNVLVRSINGGASTLIPYYVPSAVATTGKSNKLFTYYDANGLVTTNPANVRWITMALLATLGSGQSMNWEAQSEQSSSVAVKRYQ